MQIYWHGSCVCRNPTESCLILFQIDKENFFENHIEKEA